MSGSQNDRSMYENLLEEIKVVWDRTLSETERLQEIRMICMEHGWCLGCNCFHHDGLCESGPWEAF